MKHKLMIMFFLLLVSVQVFSISVEIEQVIDAPPSRWGTYLNDSAAYAKNGELLLAGSRALNLFVLKDGQWVRLIEKYKIERYNHTEENDRFRGVNYLYNSTVPEEFVYYIEMAQFPKEHYRVFVNDEGELEAEWVSEEYFDSHKFPGLGLGLSLRSGYSLKITPVEDGYAGFLVDIVGKKEQFIYRFADQFRKGYMQDIGTIATTPDRDHVAMVIDFWPEEHSPYQRFGYKYVKMLVIFKINYDE
ncbi:MAG: hypothetical protein PQJ46_00675 [Spirochaetales bacterium]|nr:hypothetical protein [Spirochaetales bacterium]